MTCDKYVILSLLCIVLGGCTSIDDIFGNGDKGEGGGETPTGLTGVWYMKKGTQNVLYINGISAENEKTIESALARQHIFDQSSILELTPPSKLEVSSVNDLNSASTGTYSVNEDELTLSFINGALTNKRLTGSYLQKDTTLSISFDKEAIVSSLRYENPSIVSLIEEYTHIIDFTYSFTRTQTDALSAIEGSYVGTATFSDLDLPPISTFTVTVKKTDDKTLTLSLSSFTYKGINMELRNIVTRADIKTDGTATFSVSNTNISMSGTPVTLSLSGTIIDGKMDVPQITVRMTGVQALFIRFISNKK